MKKLIIVLAAIFVLGGAAATGVAIYNNQPKVVARNAVLGAISGFLDRDEVEPVVKMLGGGSLEFSADVKTGLLGSFAASGKLYFSDDALMISGFKAQTGEDELSFDAYFSDDLSYISNEELLGGSYGVIRGRMASAFKSNSFWRTKLLNEEQVEALDEIFAAYDGDEYEDLEEYFEKYLKVFIKAFEDNATYSSAKETAFVDGEQADVRAVYVSVSEKGMQNIAKALYNELKNDGELREDLSVYLGKRILLYDDMIDALGKRTEVGDVEPLNVKIMTPRLSSRLIRLEMLDAGGFVLDVGEKGIKKTDKITLKVGEATALELSVDKKSGAFKLSLPSRDFEIGGELERKGKTLTIALDLIKLGALSIKNPEIDVIIKGRDKMPKPLGENEVKTVFEMPSNDLKNILYGFGIDVDDRNNAGGPNDGFLGDDDEMG